MIKVEVYRHRITNQSSPNHIRLYSEHDAINRSFATLIGHDFGCLKLCEN